MPTETALDRLRRLAGAPAATDATTVKPKPRIVPKVTALPEDPKVLRRTVAEEDEARGAQLRRERRNWPDTQADTEAPPALPKKRYPVDPLRAPQSSTAVRPARILTQPTIKHRDEFEPGSEANADRVRGMGDRLERAAPYAPANEKAQLLSVGARLGQEANILDRRPGKLADAAMSAANMATLGVPEIAGLDRSGTVEREKATRIATNTAVTPDELRATGAIGEDDLVPRTLGTDTPSVGRQVGKMVGGLAGLAGPLSAERAIVKAGLRNYGVRGTKGLARVDKTAEGIAREQRYVNPRTLEGKMARDATEFAVPGAIYDVNSALANDEDVSDRVKQGALLNVTAGVALPRAFAGASKLATKAAPAVERLREFAGEAKQAISDSRVPDRTPKYDYSSTQLDLPENSALAVKSLSSKIPDEDLAEKGRVGEVGTSEGPHITVKYGLHDNEPEKVRELLADEKPITVKMGKTSVFDDSGDGDVVKVDVDSPELRALNKKIADAMEHTDTHPGYSPHVTVAYVKPGLGKKYAGDTSLEGHTVTIDKLTFSGADGRLHEIPLGKRPSARDRLREFAGEVAESPTVKKGAATAAGTLVTRGKAKKLSGRSLPEHLTEMRARGQAREAENLSRFMEGSVVTRPVFHGTTADFDTFADQGTRDIGFHLASDARAADDRIGERHSGSIMPVWVNIKNPFSMEDEGNFSWEKVLDYAPGSDKKLDALEDELYDLAAALKAQGVPEREARKTLNARVIAHLKSEGYDGLVYENHFEGGGKSYVAFDANQIKSAIGNKGTFNKKAAAITAGLAATAALSDEGTDDRLGGAALAAGVLASKGKLKLHKLPKPAKEFTADDVMIGHLHSADLLSPLQDRLTDLARTLDNADERSLVERLAREGEAARRKAFDDGWDAIDADKAARESITEAAEKLPPEQRALLMRSGAAKEINDVGEFEPAALPFDDVHQARLRAERLARQESAEGQPHTDLIASIDAIKKIESSMRAGDDFQTAVMKLDINDRAFAVKVLPGAVLRSKSGRPVPRDTKIKAEDFDAVSFEVADRIFRGDYLYANPFLDPQLIVKLAKAHPTVIRGVGLIGAGYGVQEFGDKADNERLKWSGAGIMSLGALHALGAHPVGGKPLYKAATEFAGKKIVSGVKDERFGPLKGRDILNWISYDILATPELRAAADEYERDVAKGVARATEFAAKMRRLGPIGERYATDLITQEQWEKEVAKLSAEEKKKVFAAAQALMYEFHDLGQLEVRYGTLARAQFDRYDGQYVPYLYALHEADAARGVGGGPLPTMKPKQSAHKSRMDLPRHSRENLGQIRESGYLAERGIEKGYRNIAAAKLFSALSSMPGALHPEYEKAVRDLMAAQRSSRTGDIKKAKLRLERVRNYAKGGYDRGQLAGYKTLTNSKGYGVLAGAVVRKDIADYLEGLPHFGEKKLANDLFMQWKKIHTVFNPGTHVGNFVSNITTVHMKGLPIHEVPGAIRDAYREIKSYQDTGRGRYVRALTEAGVMDRNIATMDYSGNTLPSIRSRVGKLRELANRTTRETRQVLQTREIDPTGPQPGQSLPHAMAAATAEKGIEYSDKMAKWYNLEDNVFRVALLKKVTKPESAGGMGFNMEQGVEYVRHHMGDFRTRSHALSLARWYSPFIMYPAKMLPHMVGSIIEHPTRWMTLAAGWGIIDQIGAYASGEGAHPGFDTDLHGNLKRIGKRIRTGQIDPMDMQEDQRPSRGFGYTIPGPIQAPIKRGKNRFAVDIARWTPFSALAGQPSPGSLAAAVSTRIPALVSPGGPLADILARTQVNADPYTGEEWINPSDSPKEKAAKMVGGLVANQVLPSALAWHTPRFLKDIADKRYDKAVIDAFGFAGARPRTIMPGQRYKQDEYWKQDEREDATRALNKRMLETKDRARRQQAKDEYLERLNRIEREFQRRNTRPE